MIRYEYQWLNGTISQLNELAAQGWRVVYVHPNSAGNGYLLERIHVQMGSLEGAS